MARNHDVVDDDTTNGCDISFEELEITGLGTRDGRCVTRGFYTIYARPCTDIYVEQILAAQRKTSEVLDQLEKFEEIPDICEDSKN